MLTEEFSQVVESVWEDFCSLYKEEQDEFRKMAKEDLICLHDSLGRWIRNEYGLWENSWVPELVDGIDISPEHPDALSMKIIETVWEKANESK